MTGGAEGRKAQTRERILSAAIDLFLENGFHETNIDSLASRSHSSKQTIYKYYEDKDEILAHAIARLRKELSGDLLQFDLETDDFEAELERFGRRYLNAITHDRQVQTFRLCVEVARRTNSAAAPIGKLDSAAPRAAVRDYIQHLTHRGLISQAEDAEFMAEAFLAMVRGNFQCLKTLDAAYMPSRKVLTTHVAQVTRLFCAALRGDIA